MTYCTHFVQNFWVLTLKVQNLKRRFQFRNFSTIHCI